MKPPAAKLFPCLEGIRGAAALLVAMRHIPGPFSNVGSFPVSYLAVDVFFLLSGVVIANAYEQRLLSQRMSLAEFIARRVIRIFPLYLMGSLCGALAMLLDGGTSGTLLITFVLLAICFLPSPVGMSPGFPLNHPSWSLFFELVANFLYARVFLRWSSARLLVVMALCLAMLVSFAASRHYDLDIGYQKRWFLLGVPRVLFSFLFGVVIYRFVRDYPRKAINSNLLGTSALLGVCAALCAPIAASDYQLIFGTAAIAVVFPALILAATRLQVTGLTGRLFDLLGELSFPLYAFHVPLYMLLQSLLGRVTTFPVLFQGDMYLLIAVLSFGANRLVDVPVRKFLNAGLTRVLARRPASVVLDVRGHES